MKNKFITVVLVAALFGFTSGVVGEIVARAYLLRQAFDIPLFGEINFLEGNNGSSLVIQNPRKVIVEQNTKVTETIQVAENEVVGIYQYKVNEAVSDGGDQPKSATTTFNIDDYLKLNNESGQGLIITSDGWIISAFTPPELVPKAELTAALKTKVINNYVVLASGKQILTIDDIVVDKENAYSYWHVQADDLPVRRFVADREISNGQLVLAYNRSGSAVLTTIMKQTRGRGADLVRSSDEYQNEIKLAQSLSQEFNGAFLFNLNGDVVGLIDSGGVKLSMGSFTPGIGSLLKSKKINYPVLGLSYVDLSELVGIRTGALEQGALIRQDQSGQAIVKGSSAALAGLRAGDIILSIDNIELSREISLNQLVSERVPGDEIGIIFVRAGQTNSTKAVLGGK